MRVCLVSENISHAMSGEALLAYQYVQSLERMGVSLEIVCHERVRAELESSWGAASLQRVHFVADSIVQRLIWRSTKWLPYRIRDLVVSQLLSLVTQIRARKVVQALVKDNRIDIVFQPSPIAPKGVSCLYDLGVPVVVGPMCGGLNLPPAFVDMDSRVSRFSIRVGRILGEMLNRIYPGKIRADALIVANTCTEGALPGGCRGKIYRLVESGVDLFPASKFSVERPSNENFRFLYIGRLVDWKGILFLLQAFAHVATKTSAMLEVVGDGELMPKVKQTIREFGLEDRVTLRGWIRRSELAAFSHGCDCMVVPSLRECGGNAILETMALGLPVIATAWAGPKNYINESCGILVDPTTVDGFVAGLRDAMLKMVEQPVLRDRLGEGARERVRENFFDWDSKTRRVVEILKETLHGHIPLGVTAVLGGRLPEEIDSPSSLRTLCPISSLSP